MQLGSGFGLGPSGRTKVRVGVGAMGRDVAARGVVIGCGVYCGRLTFGYSPPNYCTARTACDGTTQCRINLAGDGYHGLDTG